jgi:hypothetical protein
LGRIGFDPGNFGAWDGGLGAGGGGVNRLIGRDAGDGFDDFAIIPSPKL